MTPASHTALIVGGHRQYLASMKLLDRLEENRIHVDPNDCWEVNKSTLKQKLTIPRQVNLVIILADLASHNLSNYAVESAKREGIPYVMTTRRWAVMYGHLVKCGIINPTTVNKEEISMEPGEQAAYEYQNGKSTTKKRYVHSDLVKAFIKGLLREDGQLSNAQIHAKTSTWGVTNFPGKVANASAYIISKCRKELGMAPDQSMSKARAARWGKKEMEAAQKDAPKQVDAPKRVLVDSAGVVKATADGVVKATAEPMMVDTKDGPVKIALPPVKRAAKVHGEQCPDDVRAGLQMLTEVMHKHGYSDFAVNEHGQVTFTKRTITTGTFSLE